jgi:hypothetical protein
MEEIYAYGLLARKPLRNAATMGLYIGMEFNTRES